MLVHLYVHAAARCLRSLRVGCGSCYGCEHELKLVSSPAVDMARYGLGIAASPRNADVLLVTGPVTTRVGLIDGKQRT